MNERLEIAIRLLEGWLSNPKCSGNADFEVEGVFRLADRLIAHHNATSKPSTTIGSVPDADAEIAELKAENERLRNRLQGALDELRMKARATE